MTWPDAGPNHINLLFRLESRSRSIAFLQSLPSNSITFRYAPESAQSSIGRGPSCNFFVLSAGVAEKPIAHLINEIDLFAK